MDTTLPGGINGGNAQTPSQMAANAQAANPGIATGPGSLDPTLPKVSQTQDASQINNHISDGTNISLPPFSQPSANTANGLNSSVSIPSATDALSQAPADTTAQAQQKGLLQKIAGLVGGQKSLATDQTQQESQGGVSSLKQIMDDLGNKLTGLSDQGTLLENAAAPGGSIENQEQLDIKGRGVTSGGLAPMTADDQRRNQIQQQSIAAQSLQTKSAYLAAQGKYAAAKDAADKAAQVIFDGDTQQINAAQSQLAALAPQLTKDETAQAAATKAALDAKALAITYAHDDYVSGQGLINAALTNSANNPQGQMAAQAAAKLDPKDPNYLQKVQALVGQYQKDPIAIQQAIANLQLTRAQTSKAQADAANANLTGNAQVLSPYLKTSYDGSQYVDLSTLSPTDKNKYAQIASQNGLKIVQTPADADKIAHIAVTKSNLNDIINTFNSVPVEKDIPFFQGVDNSIKNFFGDSTIRSYQDFRTSAINTLQALAGGSGSGFRVTQSEIAAAIKDIPILTGPSADTRASAQKKIDNLNGQIDKWSTQILGGGNTATKDANNTTKSGKPFDYAKAKADGVSDADIQAYLASH